ncbi:MAG: HEAT repeat domain-containing protein [Phycisphaerae bacterium]
MRWHVAGAIAVLGLSGILAGGCRDPSKDLESGDPAKRFEAIRALAREDSDAAAEKICEAVNTRDLMTAQTAVRSLGQMKAPRAQSALKEIAKREPRRDVRQEAVTALGYRHDESSPEILRQLLQTDPDPQVRGAAATALGRVGNPGDIPLMVDVMLADEDVLVQGRAVGAIERFVGVRFMFDETAPPQERRKRLEEIQAEAFRMLNWMKGAKAHEQGRTNP